MHEDRGLGWPLPSSKETPEQRRDKLRGQLYNLFMVPPLSLYAFSMPYSAKPLASIQCNGRRGAEVLGLGGGLGGWPPLALLCQGCVGGEWRTEHFPVILPDSPGAWEVGVSLSEGEGGPAGAQKLGYFCNTEHICNQPQRRSNSGRRAGMQGPRQRGELWFHRFWKLGGPLQCPLGKVGLPSAKCMGWGGTGLWC